MTKVEQYLIMVKRELMAMSRDQLGSYSRTSYADRVIADVCGIEGFASSVLASRNPSAVILNAIRSARGDCIMRFFSEKMHDARLELVEVLSEAVRAGRSSVMVDRDAHSYLHKLYVKAVKKTRKLVGSKVTKEVRINYDYPELSRITGSFGHRGFSYFSDDDEDSDSEDDSYSRYVDDYFEALTTGKDLPKPIAYMSKEPDMDLDIDPDILRLIDNIQRRLGRRLSSAEIADIIREVDDDDDLDVPSPEKIIGLDAKSQKLVDAIANVVVAKLVSQGAVDSVQAPAKDASEIDPDEIHMKDDLDEFLETGVVVPVKDVPKVTKLPVTEPVSDQQVDDSTTIPTKTLISVVNGVDKGEESEEDTSSEIEPPVDEAGGETIVDKPLAVQSSDNDALDGDFMDERLIDRTARNILEDLQPQIVSAVKAYIASNDAVYVGVYLNLVPSMSENYLLEFRARVLIDGNVDGYSISNLRSLIGRFGTAIAERLQIPSDSIFHAVDLLDTADEETLFMNTAGLIYSKTGLFETDFRDLESTLTGLAINIYKESKVFPLVTGILDPDKKLLTFVLGTKPKHSEPKNSFQMIKAATKFIRNYLENLTCDWVTFGGLDYGIGAIDLCDVQNPIAEMRGMIQKRLTDSVPRPIQEAIDDVAELMLNFHCHLFESMFGRKIDLDNIGCDMFYSEVPDGISMDIRITINYPNGALTPDRESEFDTRVRECYFSSAMMENLLRVFCVHFKVDTYYRLSEESSDDFEEYDELQNSEPLTNSFGMPNIPDTQENK